ncbi:hypothetical protein [Leptospira interrogans]|uniref:hypothetical protein n=1 Tax=Leptospira interrogans TaxID=173 RepID=UPI0007733F37|nr:hypothetical protein [Leptospira interrogans]
MDLTILQNIREFPPVFRKEAEKLWLSWYNTINDKVVIYLDLNYWINLLNARLKVRNGEKFKENTPIPTGGKKSWNDNMPCVRRSSRRSWQAD